MGWRSQVRGVAAAFYECLQQPLAREVFVRYGFELPGEATR